MRNLKIVGFVAACIAPIAVLMLVSIVLGPDDVHAPPPVAIPSDEPPVVTQDEPAPMNVPESSVINRPGGRIVYDSADVGRIVRPGDEKPITLDMSDELYLGSGLDWSYNPELRRMGLHVDNKGDLRHGTKENPGEKTDWETLRRKQRGDDCPT